MRILALDLSLHAGWAIFDYELNSTKLLAFGTLHGDGLTKFGPYPWNYYLCALAQIREIRRQLVDAHKPHVIVVEETNGSKSRYTQKLLEFLHFALLDGIADYYHVVEDHCDKPAVVYVNTNDWRSNLGIWLSKEQKKSNQKLSKAKSGLKADLGRAPTPSELATLKKGLGIRGKFNKKHAAIDYINGRADLGIGKVLKKKDNDAAEAICIGLAYLNDVPHCDGE